MDWLDLPAVQGTLKSLLQHHSSKASILRPAACSFPGENARSWEALGEARPGQSSLSAGALTYFF